MLLEHFLKSAEKCTTICDMNLCTWLHFNLCEWEPFVHRRLIHCKGDKATRLSHMPVYYSWLRTVTRHKNDLIIAWNKGSMIGEATFPQSDANSKSPESTQTSALAINAFRLETNKQVINSPTYKDRVSSECCLRCFQRSIKIIWIHLSNIQ